MNVHIDTTGMTEHEKTVALITEVFKHITMQKKKKKFKAKEIRAENRKREKTKKVKKKYNL